MSARGLTLMTAGELAGGTLVARAPSGSRVTRPLTGTTKPRDHGTRKRGPWSLGSRQEDAMN